MSRSLAFMFNFFTGPAAQSTPAVMDSLKGLVDTVKVNKIMLASNHGQPVESPIAQRKSITNLPCYKGKVIYPKFYIKNEKKVLRTAIWANKKWADF